MVTWEDIKHDAVALRRYLDNVDTRLAGEGVAIHARSFHAWIAVQRACESAFRSGTRR